MTIQLPFISLEIHPVIVALIITAAAVAYLIKRYYDNIRHINELRVKQGLPVERG